MRQSETPGVETRENRTSNLTRVPHFPTNETGNLQGSGKSDEVAGARRLISIHP
jgi:hypothetical protein